MPYIEEESRGALRETLFAMCPGELNYLFTYIINEYVNHDFNYQRINDVIGALEGAKLEFYRRHVVPYEEEKRRQNGDV